MSANTPAHSSQIGRDTSIGNYNESIFILTDSALAAPDHTLLADVGLGVEGGHTQSLGFAAPEVTADVSMPPAQIDDMIGTNFLSSGDHGSSTPTQMSAHVPELSHHDVLVSEIGYSYVIDRSDNQLPGLALNEDDGLSDRWAAGLDGQANRVLPSDEMAGVTAAPAEPHFFVDTGFDARGGGGSHPGGGGGGGGGGGTVLTTYTSGDPNVDDANEFNITIDFTGTNWTAQEQAIVIWAAELWSDVITGDVRNDTDLNGNPVDDIVITMSIGRIDGPGNPKFGDILAETQIDAVRDPGSIDQWLPVTSSILLDSTDLSNSIKGEWSGTWDSIILHEMGHALGFAGIIFDNLSLLDNSGNFIGDNAVTAYGNGTFVPIENDGGSGTAGSHWDETTFAPNGDITSNEIMTGYVDKNEQTVLSDTTVGAFADLGYQVQDPSATSPELVIDNHLLLV